MFHAVECVVLKRFRHDTTNVILNVASVEKKQRMVNVVYQDYAGSASESSMTFWVLSGSLQSRPFCGLPVVILGSCWRSLVSAVLGAANGYVGLFVALSGPWAFLALPKCI